jgi:hypothetical protein
MLWGWSAYVLSTERKKSEGGNERPRSTYALLKTHSSGARVGVMESLVKLQESGATSPSFSKALSSDSVTSQGHH